MYGVTPLGTMDHLSGLVIRELPLQGATKDAEKTAVYFGGSGAVFGSREPFSRAGAVFGSSRSGSRFREPPLRGPFSGAAPESLEPLFEAVSHDFIKRT